MNTLGVIYHHLDIAFRALKELEMTLIARKETKKVETLKAMLVYLHKIGDRLSAEE